jgi:hypothetical protein
MAKSSQNGLARILRDWPTANISVHCMCIVRGDSQRLATWSVYPVSRSAARYRQWYSLYSGIVDCGIDSKLGEA